MSQSTTATASQPGTSLLPDGGVGVITTMHLVLIALVAVAAIAIILVGIRRKRQRTLAERQVAHVARLAGAQEVDIAKVVRDRRDDADGAGREVGPLHE